MLENFKPKCNQNLTMYRQILTGAALLGLLSACSGSGVPDCSGQTGFDLGKNSIEPPGECQEAAFTGAWHLGQSLAELESEREELRARQADLDTTERMRLRVLERDIPELETLARIHGFIEPATVDQ
jgi:hypothetical protein